MLNRFVFVVLGALFLFSLSGCETQKTKDTASQFGQSENLMFPWETFEDFVVVIAREGDTFSLLAKNYMQDSKKDWVLKELNGVESIKVGESVIVPKKPIYKGGVSLAGHQRVPVLLYHKFSETKTDKMTVSKEGFAKQMEYLKINGYSVITMDSFYKFLEFKDEIPPKSVVIAIDDGWCSFFEIGYPVLRQHDYPATLFLYSGIIHNNKCLSWDQVKEMSQNGISIQNHTKSHKSIIALDADQTLQQYYEDMEREISETHNLITQKIGVEPKYLAYPYGDTNYLFMALMKKYDYRLGFTVNRGGSPFYANNYRLGRSMIFGEYDIKKFKKNLKVWRAAK